LLHNRIIVECQSLAAMMVEFINIDFHEPLLSLGIISYESIR